MCLGMNPDKVPDGVHCALLATGTHTAKDLGLRPIFVAQQWPLQQQSLSIALLMCAKCQKSSKRRKHEKFTIYTGTNSSFDER